MYRCFWTIAAITAVTAIPPTFRRPDHPPGSGVPKVYLTCSPGRKYGTKLSPDVHLLRFLNNLESCHLLFSCYKLKTWSCETEEYTYDLLPTIDSSYLLLNTYFLIPPAHDSLLITHCSLFTAHYSLLTTHYSLLITDYSLLTHHYSLLSPTTCVPTTRRFPFLLRADSSAALVSVGSRK